MMSTNTSARTSIMCSVASMPSVRRGSQADRILQVGIWGSASEKSGKLMREKSSIRFRSLKSGQQGRTRNPAWRINTRSSFPSRGPAAHGAFYVANDLLLCLLTFALPTFV